MFEQISNDELLSIIFDKDLYLWQGRDDTIEKYQARLAERFSATLLLVSREILSGENIIDIEMAKTIFYDILRHHDDKFTPGGSGTGGFFVRLLINFWKLRRH